jgi:hypothetical protein
MFRGNMKMDGKFQRVELTEDEMNELLVLAATFNRKAYAAAKQQATILLGSNDITKDELHQVTLAIFDKLAIQTFSVVNNRIVNL